ncbi:MAG: response regulator transcription factor [Nocardioidaceae bacterium]|nr:response regulator transcription factor [Nocardioidaceae bacterium]
MSPRVLVVDDEPMVREVLARYLERDGFTVDLAVDGVDALQHLESVGADLVVLDLMLPRLDGFEVLRRLRSRVATPVIMLTARGDQIDRIVGLEVGADDYVIKPFSPREVVARVRAVLRRAAVRSAPDESTIEQDVRRIGSLTIDIGRRLVTRDGADLRLTRKEFDLLTFLAARAGQTFSRSQLLEQVWDFAWTGDASTVTVHVRRLREKIEVDPSEPRNLITVWGVGYRFET